jgi:hypothetical protein
MIRHPEKSEDCPKGDYGHCDHWYDGGRCCHCEGPMNNPDERTTPARLSLVGKRVTLRANPEEGMEQEDLDVEADYELKKPDGYERWLQGTLASGDAEGEYTEAPYDQVERVHG